MITIAQHTAQIDMVAELYKRNSGEDKFSVMSDVLADLLLWSRTNAIDFADALRLGRLHADAEWSEAAQQPYM